MALPASMRLRGHRSFNRLHRAGIRFQGRFMALRIVQGKKYLLKKDLQLHSDEHCRLAVVISNKVSKRSVRRNRLRRTLHNRLKSMLRFRTDLQGQWLLFSLTPSAGDANVEILFEECDSLLRSAGVIK